MKIKLSYRDINAATTDVFHDTSETANNFPKQHFQGLDQKPQVSVHIKMDKDRADLQRNEAMGLNVLNQLSRTDNLL